MAELCVKVAEFIVTLIRESLDLFRRIDSLQLMSCTPGHAQKAELVGFRTFLYTNFFLLLQKTEKLSYKI